MTGGDDSHWYFHMWLVGLGRETFERVVDDPDTLVDVPEVRRFLAMQRDGIPRTDEDLPDLEALDYVPVKAWERATGKDSDLFYRALEARMPEFSSSPSPSGEQWHLEDRAESERRLPRCNHYIRALYGRAPRI
ncbi:DUF4240 domain-containing protein [Nonomuraea sp. NPDC050536]|uniref:DUF4240 domain-containing protein n=1 Tax=Nonomuraea sp. NPDC050536 TaxID=3364366 RepID=UPI0037C7C090